MLKLCKKCLVEKPIEQFVLNKKNYYCSPCRGCRRLQTKKWISLNPEIYKQCRKKSNEKYNNKNISIKDYKESKAKYTKKIIETLADTYVKSKLRGKAKVTTSIFPPDMIEAYRTSIKIKRLIRGAKNEQ
jgi:hypothetical protein